MKPTRVIFGTFFLMIVIQTYNSIDGQHRLPAPRKFVAIGAVWGVLFLMADIGWGKIAARLAMLILLTSLVIGPFGTLLIRFFNTVTNTFAIPPAQDPGVPGTPGTPGVPGTDPIRPRGKLA